MGNYNYNGIAGSQVDAPMSYADIYNAQLNPTKEKLEYYHEPTPNNVKLNAGEDYINIRHRKLESDMINTREPSQTYVNTVAPEGNNCGISRMKNILPNQQLRDRLDENILYAYKNNPYTQSLASSV